MAWSSWGHFCWSDFAWPDCPFFSLESSHSHNGRRRQVKVGLEAGPARYNVSNVDRGVQCTQITINLGGSLQLPAEAALLCKDWLLQYVRRPGCGLRRTESANPAGVILIKCCLFEKDDTHTPSSLCYVVVLSGYHQRPPFNCPTIQRTNWNDGRFPANHHRRQYFHQIIVESSSSIFCPKAENTRQWWRCRHSAPECQFAKGNWFRLMCVYSTTRASSTWNPIQIIAHVNYTYFALYQTRGAATELNTFVLQGKKLDFLLTRTYYFLVTLFLFFPAFSC